jgi:PIN domain nuclease of toxin-antitoxin system
MNGSTKVILDASALITVFSKEPGCENVLPLLSHAVMSSVNIAEVAKYLIERKAIDREIVETIIGKLLEEIIPFDSVQAYISAELALNTKKYGLSLGDRACLALAKSQGFTVYTADKAWQNITVDGVNIKFIR